MTDKEKIRKEVERLMYGFNLEADIASCENDETEELADIKYRLCKKILEYIDSLQGETVSEDLEEAVDEYAPDFSNSVASKATVDAVRDAFKAGAQWKEQQMMTKAIDAHCFALQNGEAIFAFKLPVKEYLVGSEIKVIIKQE